MWRCWDSRSPRAIKGREPGVCGRQVLRDARSRGCEMTVSRRARRRERKGEAGRGGDGAFLLRVALRYL